MIGVVVATLVAVGAVASPASAGEVYVSLGDSYTAAPLVPDEGSSPLICTRSSENYPSVVARTIAASYFRDVSCSGAVIDDYSHSQADGVPPQFDGLRPDATLVTTGIAGNDAGLVQVGFTCIGLGLLNPTGSPCRDMFTAGGVDQVGRKIEAAAPRLGAALREIHRRSPRARVLAVGYPSVVPADGRSCWPLPLPIGPEDVRFFNTLLVRINAMIAREAAANGAEYVDTYTKTLGHDVCQPPDRAAFAALLSFNGPAAPAHPNQLGEHLMAEAVLDVLRRPRPAVPTVTPARPAVHASTAVRPRVTRIRLTPHRLALRVSTAATVKATLARRVSVRSRSHGRPCVRRVWRTSRRVTFHATRGRTLRRRLSRLAPGRYRVTVRVRGADGRRGATRHALRTIRR